VRRRLCCFSVTDRTALLPNPECDEQRQRKNDSKWPLEALKWDAILRNYGIALRPAAHPPHNVCKCA
jgi:hypothetical protein